MNEKILLQQEDRGRLIAHVFYSELEKIARVAQTRGAMTKTIEAGRELLKKDIQMARGSAPKNKWYQLRQKFKDGRDLRGKEKGWTKAQDKYDDGLKANYRSDRVKALDDLSGPDAGKQQAAREFLGSSSKPVKTPSNRKTSDSGPKPTGDGPTRNFAETIGRATIGTAVAGTAGYGGYKYLKSRNNSTPYSAYSGGY